MTPFATSETAGSLSSIKRSARNVSSKAVEIGDRSLTNGRWRATLAVLLVSHDDNTRITSLRLMGWSARRQATPRRRRKASASFRDSDLTDRVRVIAAIFLHRT